MNKSETLEPSVLGHKCNPSTWEAEEERREENHNLKASLVQARHTVRPCLKNTTKENEKL